MVCISYCLVTWLTETVFIIGPAGQHGAMLRCFELLLCHLDHSDSVQHRAGWAAWGANQHTVFACAQSNTGLAYAPSARRLLDAAASGESTDSVPTVRLGTLCAACTTTV